MASYTSSHSCIVEVLQCLLCCEEETLGGGDRYDRRPFPPRPLVAFFSWISTAITHYLQVRSRHSSSPSTTVVAQDRNPRPRFSTPNTTANQRNRNHSRPSMWGASITATAANSSNQRANQPRPPISSSAVVHIRRRPRNSLPTGAQIHVVIEDRPPETRLQANLGDYFIGPGLEQLIQQLAENDPNRYGTPPASKSSVQALPTIKSADKHLNSEMNQCAVCQDDFEKHMEVKQMPCEHIYHPDCLLRWLEMHSTCPICRYQLPTDDADYESTRRARARGE